MDTAMSTQANHSRPPAVMPHGPPTAFAAAVLTALAVLALTAATQPPGLALPVVSAAFLVLAAVVAIAARRRGLIDRQGPELTYWDVAGALTFIGIFAGTLIDPEHMVRIFEGADRDN
jgi:hypothetical protein